MVPTAKNHSNVGGLIIYNTSATFLSTNPTLKRGQIAKETDTNRYKQGDGVTPWQDLTHAEWGFEIVQAAGIDTYAATFSTPFLLAYFDRMRIRVRFGTGNTGAATLNLNSLGAIDIKKNVSIALVAGDIIANAIYDLEYDGTNFQIVASSGGNASLGLWANSKYWIEAGDSVTVPTLFQHLYSNELINDGEITNDGELIEV